MVFSLSSLVLYTWRIPYCTIKKAVVTPNTIDITYITYCTVPSKTVLGRKHVLLRTNPCNLLCNLYCDGVSRGVLVYTLSPVGEEVFTNSGHATDGHEMQYLVFSVYQHLLLSVLAT